MKSELVPLNGDPPIPIIRDLTVIGRREYCDVVIPQTSLSKRHCIVVRTDGLLMLRDLATTNGTKVNGQRVSWAALLPNDRLNIGGYKVRVYLGPDDAPSPSEEHAAAQAPRYRVHNPVLTPVPDDHFPEPEPEPENAGNGNSQSGPGFPPPTPDEGTSGPVVLDEPSPLPAPPPARIAVEEDEDPGVADVFAQLRLNADDRMLDLD